MITTIIIFVILAGVAIVQTLREERFSPSNTWTGEFHRQPMKIAYSKKIGQIRLYLPQPIRVGQMADYVGQNSAGQYVYIVHGVDKVPETLDFMVDIFYLNSDGTCESWSM